MGKQEIGIVKWFDAGRGYGYITRDQGGDVFVHDTAILGAGPRSLEEGQKVEFTVVQGAFGPLAEELVILT